jgi:hypothetical protein
VGLFLVILHWLASHAVPLSYLAAAASVNSLIVATLQHIIFNS